MLTYACYLALNQKWKYFYLLHSTVFSCIPQILARCLAYCDMFSSGQKGKFLLQVSLETQTLICVMYLAIVV